MIASSFQTIASVSALKVRLYSRARALFSNLLFCDYRATTTRDGRQRLRRRCRQQKTERERDEWDNFVYLSPSLSQILGGVLWWGVKKRTLSLISEGRRSIRGRSALILICHSDLKRSFVVEGGSFRRRKVWERDRRRWVLFFGPPTNKSASLPSKIRKKRRKMALF